MDDLSERLAELLNDPESLERVRSVAENFLGGEKSGNRQAPSSDLNSVLGDSGLDPGLGTGFYIDLIFLCVLEKIIFQSSLCRLGSALHGAKV